MTDTARYNSSFAGKGAMLAGTRCILEALDAGRDLESVRRTVADGMLIDRGTRRTRENVWKEVFRRYISERETKHVATLARMATHCPVPGAVDLVLFYEYCQADALLYDLTAHCTYELYQNARTAIDHLDLGEWLGRQETEHPEIAGWSPATRRRLIGSYLSTIRDFGLVTGAKRKEFHKFYVPREAFVYALYHQKDRGIEGKPLIQSTDWRLFLLSRDEVIFHIEDAANGGFIHFRRAGDVYDLRFVYDSLKEVVDVCTHHVIPA